MLNSKASFWQISKFLTSYLLLFFISNFCILAKDKVEKENKSANKVANNFDTDKIKVMKLRNIGPAGMSGRVTAIDVVENQQNIIYIGAASGGVWKSYGGGVSWQPIFDKENTQSIGAIKIDQSNPDHIWVGTGEGNPRNSQNNGRGIFKSIDAGKTWKNMGLENTSNIHRIIINKNNSDIVYAGVLGNAWADSKDRGLYRTTNSGKTWEQILYVDQRTGVADMVVDPINPKKIFVSMWEFRRNPWFFKSGGKSSGLYLTLDGGDTWKKLSDKEGLPSGELGRIGIAIAKSSPNVVYATVESAKNALYRSIDGGNTWQMQNNSSTVDRPFYYSEIYCDPENENRLYYIHTLISKSEDAGKTFSQLMPYSLIHPDHHAFWVSSKDPNFLIEGNDGGMSISRDKGATWQFVENLPLGQFYHIDYDMQVPYNVYGGMQDNGSWRGPSAVWRSGGIRNSYWEEVLFGDGFDVVPDKSDSNFLYAMYQGGNLSRYNLSTGASNYIKPIHPKGTELRFNWNTGIAHDNFDNKTIYYGSQFLLKSTDRGENWTIISEDLTTNDTNKLKQSESGGLTYDVTGAENHCTIISIATSSIKKDLIWVGTDDGNIQVTEDAGKSWNLVSSNIKSMPKAAWVCQVHASSFESKSAFAVVNNYRQGDQEPYLYYTQDMGKSWRNILDGMGIDGHVLSFVQDSKEANLMFLGTDVGLYFSLNAGNSWTKWSNEYPSVPTIDLKIHPRDNDLIVGTFGRAAWILDDITPLRELAKNNGNASSSKIKIYPISNSILADYKQAPGTRFAGNAIYAGQNKSGGAMINFWINKVKEEAKKDTSKEALEKEKTKVYTLSNDSALVEIFNSKDENIRRYRIKIDSNLNRTYWYQDRRGQRFPTSPAPKIKTLDDESAGIRVLPGVYKVKITYSQTSDSAMLKVMPDPRDYPTMAELVEKDKMIDEFNKLVEKSTNAMDRVAEIRKSLDISATLYEFSADSVKKAAEKIINSTKDSLKTIVKLMQYEEEKQGIVRDYDNLASDLGTANYYLSSLRGKANSNVINSIEICKSKTKIFIDKLNNFFKEDWAKAQTELEKLSPKLLKNYDLLKSE